MEFSNERTWLSANESGTQEEFHTRFESAVYKVREDFGDTHAIHIGDEAIVGRPTFEDRSPADLRILLGRFQAGTTNDAKRAIAASKSAFPEWSRTDPIERVKIMLRAADRMSADKYELAALLSFENGKNRFEAVADVDEAIDFLRYYAQQVVDNQGFDRPMGQAVKNERSRSVLRPYGVWAVISPFNFPLAIATGMTAGALITGNTAVLKPASDTPFMALRLYETLRESDLPPGVLNYVTGGGGTVGAALTSSDDVDGLAFTGSRDVGLAAFRAFIARRPRPVVTEMGGKNPAIVTARADLDLAAEGVMRGAFGYGGQKCSATSRVLVEKKVQRDFLEALVEKTDSLVLGPPWERDVFLGPVINEAAFETFRRAARLGAAKGKVLTGGMTRTEGILKHGYYVEPTIVDRLPPRHRFHRDELFVPILSVIPFNGLDDALTIANGSEYGLTAGIFSRDPREVQTFFDRIEAGVAYANRRQGSTTGAMVGCQPFGGWKMSSVTFKGAGGPYYLQQFLREQARTTYV
jgi:1-pyrroline-5-carboxylate dehydrogenase